MINTRTLTAVFLVLLLLLQYKLWFASDGLHQTWQLKKAITLQSNRNEKLVQHNKLLSLQVNELKQGRGVVEDLARENLGMLKEDEQFYQFI